MRLSQNMAGLTRLIWVLALFNTTVALTATEPAQTQTIELGAEMLNPRVTWQDLNGDGRQDIWVIDLHRRAAKDRMWAALADTPNQFQELRFEPFPGKIFPRFVDQQFQVCAYSHGVLWCFNKDQGWQVAHDFNQTDQVRPGMGLVPLENNWMLATARGYLVLEQGCVATELSAPPAVDISNRRMRLTYPIPQPTTDPDRLASRPIAIPQAGEIRFWTAEKKGETWQAAAKALLFPDGLQPMRHQIGDLNGDGAMDLVILAMPSKKLSLFGELSILIYLGDGQGGWETNASQQFKSKQNFWQTGPIEMDRNGLRLYYYKGILRSIFRADTYRWNEAGYIEPKPVVTRWTLPDGDRGFINLDWDLNGDGRRDLLLRGEDGLQVFYRQSGDSPFDKKATRVLSANTSGSSGVSIEIGADFETTAAARGLNQPNQITHHKSAFIGDAAGNLWIWRLERSINGPWLLEGQRQ